MTYNMISYDNLEVSIIGALVSAVIVGAIVVVSSFLKQPVLKPIPVRVRRENDRARRTYNR